MCETFFPGQSEGPYLYCFPLPGVLAPTTQEIVTEDTTKVVEVDLVGSSTPVIAVQSQEHKASLLVVKVLIPVGVALFCIMALVGCFTLHCSIAL